jgi:ketosteroid isomerase-like protein
MDRREPDSTESSVHAWMESFADCVRRRDFEGGRRLVAPDIYGFGTRAEAADGWPALFADQWHPTWLRTRGFEFETDTVRVILSPDGRQVVATACWASEGVDTPDAWPSQTPYPRHGRATLVLVRQPDHGWLAVHTHFSIRPGAQRV